MSEFPVPFNDRLISYTAAGGETAHDFDFPVYAQTDISVIRIRSGTVTTLTLTTHYTVALNADQEGDPGGTVTLVTAATAADVHLIIGATVVERATDFAQRGGWNAADINEQFDRLIMMLQEMKRVGMAWDSHTTATIGNIPYDIAANQFLRRNSGNTDWEAVTVATSGTTVVTANDTTEGIVELATDAETLALTATNRAVTPGNLGALNASATQEGLIEIATNAEYLAKTATDKAMVPSNLAALPTFLAHKNGTDQTGITSGADVKITFGSELFDIGGYFASSTWTPPAGKYRVSVTARLDSTNGVDNEAITFILRKNGSAHRQKTQRRSGTGSVSCDLTVIVEANGTDTFEVYVNKTGAGDGVVEGATILTWFCGEAIA